MTKIFISHASADANLVNALMDLIQGQFNLTRENFFNTSDEQLKIGSNWIEEIREGMHQADLIMPIITPSYLESAFCISELGAAWVNVANLIPIIVPPLNYKALDATPYRSWLQTIQLDSEGLTRLFDAINGRGIGSGANITRFNKRSEDFQKEKLLPFIEAMKQREVITPALVKQLRDEIAQLRQAFEMTDDEVKQLKDENEKLRSMKDAEEIKKMDYAQMNEWDTFMEAVEQVKRSFRPLDSLAISAMYHQLKDDSGYSTERSDLPKMRALESEGIVKWDDGWLPDYGHPRIEQADVALTHLQNVIANSKEILKERFNNEYPDVRFGLQYSPCWEALFEVNITLSE